MLKHHGPLLKVSSGFILVYVEMQLKAISRKCWYDRYDIYWSEAGDLAFWNPTNYNAKVRVVALIETIALNVSFFYCVSSSGHVVISNLQ